MRRFAGARDQRVTGLSPTGACRLHRPSRSATPCGSCQPCRRWRPCDASRGGGRYHSAIGVADRHSYQWFTQAAAGRAPSWRNEVTLRTIEYAFGYEPGAYIGLISPTPLLLIVAVKDHLCGVRSCHRRVRACLGAKTLGAVAGWTLRGVRRGIRSIVRPSEPSLRLRRLTHGFPICRCLIS